MTAHFTRKFTPRPKVCSECGAPDAVMVWRSRKPSARIPGRWSDEEDLVRAHPNVWQQIGSIVELSPVTGRCKTCALRIRRARKDEAA